MLALAERAEGPRRGARHGGGLCIASMPVWVLGSGFSRSLGGPLLKDLLSSRALSSLRSLSDLRWAGDDWLTAIVKQFKRGVKDDSWTNAEEYMAKLASLDHLAHAELGGQLRESLRSLSFHAGAGEPSDLGQMTDYDICETAGVWVNRLVAAQCMNFVERSWLEPELWLPYERWARDLNPQEDVVVTFNYDEVVEKAFDRAGCSYHCPNPRFPATIKDQAGDVLLLKLHGSVSFRDTVKEGETDSIRNVDSNPPFLATPGQSKADMVETEFMSLWDLAFDSIVRANFINIVGYSCPSSDEMAKAFLIEAVRSADDVKRIRIALGHDRMAAERLCGLLDHAPCKPDNTGLFATDFIAKTSRKQDWRPDHQDRTRT